MCIRDRELIIDPACSIIFEAEKEEANVMKRPPRKIHERFFNGKKIALSCAQGACILIVVLVVYFIGLHRGYPEKEVRALSFLTLIVSNVAIILSNRSWSRNIFQIIISPNKAVKWIVGGAILFLILILNVPFLRNLFLFDPIHFRDAVICSIAGIFSITWFELYKLRNVKKGKREIQVCE